MNNFSINLTHLLNGQVILIVIFYLQVSRLKEPRQLFAITTSTLGPQQQARWPAELEVAIEKLKHSFNSPSVKEPFYIKSKYAAL